MTLKPRRLAYWGIRKPTHSGTLNYTDSTTMGICTNATRQHHPKSHARANFSCTENLCSLHPVLCATGISFRFLLRRVCMDRGPGHFELHVVVRPSGRIQRVLRAERCGARSVLCFCRSTGRRVRSKTYGQLAEHTRISDAGMHFPSRMSSSFSMRMPYVQRACCA